MRQGVFSVVVTCIGAAGARADWTGGSAANSMDVVCVVGEADRREVLLFGLPINAEIETDLYSKAGCFPFGLPAVLDEQTGSKQALDLTDGCGSLDLCLYALIGLGLFRSGHCVRRSSLGFVAEWYYSGGPQQIGCSHAVGPGACCVETVCFVQPDAVPDHLLLYAGRGIIPSLARSSQFTAAVLACRAPPSLS